MGLATQAEGSTRIRLHCRVGLLIASQIYCKVTEILMKANQE
jgi:hypothetical protein